MFEIFLVMPSICIEDFNPAFHCHNFCLVLLLQKVRKNDSVIRAVNLAHKIKVRVSTTKKIQMINCPSQGHHLVSKAPHHISPSQKVHTPCHTNRTQ